MNRIQMKRTQISGVLARTEKESREGTWGDRTRQSWKGFLVVTTIFALVSLAFLTKLQAKSPASFEEKMRRALVTLPYYSVFDNLAFRIESQDKVVLIGHVTRPTLKSRAENVIKRLQQVDSVDNQIEVLPLSPYDDRIRLATFWAIYYDSVLTRYAVRAIPSIHIIVRNGDVTLEGTVASESDRNVAYIRANGVPGVFSVTNNLQVD